MTMSCRYSSAPLSHPTSISTCWCGCRPLSCVAMEIWFALAGLMLIVAHCDIELSHVCLLENVCFVQRAASEPILWMFYGLFIQIAMRFALGNSMCNWSFNLKIHFAVGNAILSSSFWIVLVKKLKWKLNRFHIAVGFCLLKWQLIL